METFKNVLPYNVGRISEDESTKPNLFDQDTKLFQSVFDTLNQEPLPEYTSGFKKFPLSHKFVWNDSVKEHVLNILKEKVNKDTKLKLVGDMESIYYYDNQQTPNKRSYVFNVYLQNTSNAFTRKILVYIRVNIQNKLLNNASEQSENPNAIILPTDLTLVNISFVEVDKTKFIDSYNSNDNQYHIMNKYHLMDPFMTSGKDIQVTNKMIETFNKKYPTLQF
jgi:hypothetical protein